MADNILDAFVTPAKEKTVVYTKPFQLALNVAFEILSWEIIPSRYVKENDPKPKTTSRVIKKCDNYSNIMVYPGIPRI